MVSGSMMSMDSIALTSPARMLPFIVRSRVSLYLAASASNFSPSWKVTPGRSVMTSLVGLS